MSATVTPGGTATAVPDGVGAELVGCELPITVLGGAGSNVGPDDTPADDGTGADGPAAASTIPGGDEDAPADGTPPAEAAGAEPAGGTLGAAVETARGGGDAAIAGISPNCAANPHAPTAATASAHHDAVNECALTYPAPLNVSD